MRQLAIALVTLLSIHSTPSQAADGFSRLGAEIKALTTPIGLGVLFGWRYLFHTSPYFSVGGAGYTGQIASGTTSSYSYGGMIGAFHIPFNSQTQMEVTILGGGGGGRLGDGTFFGGTVVEPGLGFSFKLGKGVQFVVGGSYVWMPGATQGSGMSGGVKFEFLSDNRPEPTVPPPSTRPAPEAARPTAAPIPARETSSAAPRPGYTNRE